MARSDDNTSQVKAPSSRWCFAGADEVDHRAQEFENAQAGPHHGACDERAVITMDRRDEAAEGVAHDQRFVFGWLNHMIDKGEYLTTHMSFRGKRDRRTRASFAVVTLAWLRSSSDPEIKDAWERKIRWFNDFGGAHEFFDHQTGSSATDVMDHPKDRLGTVLIVSDFANPPNVERVHVSGGDERWRGHISKSLSSDPAPLLEPAESCGSRNDPLSIHSLG